MEQEYHLKNVMESLVDQRMNELLPRLGGCNCERCRLDIKAYALNHLPIQYVVTREGELFSKLNSLGTQYNTDISAKIAEAAKHVWENPRH